MEQLINKNWLNKFKHIEKNIAAKDWTFLGVGGKPLFSFFPQNTEEIQNFIKNKPKTLIYRTLGAGSNILVRDAGYDGAFIRLNKHMRKLEMQDNLLIAECGVNFTQIQQFCVQNEQGNLEFLSTIPGQVGGWIKMNAGIPNKEIKDVLAWVEFIDETGSTQRINNSECQFQYRSSCIQNHWILTKAAFITTYKSKEEIMSTIKKEKKHRTESQPTIGKLAGCFFKNPSAELKAWQLIEQSQIYSCGGTKISEKHKNFLVADNSNNAEEIEFLIEAIRAKILYQNQIFLESEVERIGKKG